VRYDRTRPAMVQKDLTVLLECRHPDYEEARAAISRFADLIKSPEPLHTYRITPLSLWNAASAGLRYDDIISTLQRYSKWEIPPEACRAIASWIGRYGLLRLEAHGTDLRLVADGALAVEELFSQPAVRTFLKEQIGPRTYVVSHEHRGQLKQELTRIGFPVLDLAGYRAGERLEIALNSRTRLGKQSFALRAYQREAVRAFFGEEGSSGGSGVLVLPCGAGKTVIGIAIMAEIGQACLILTSNVASVRQWKREIVDKTTLDEQWIGEYTGEEKEVRPVTIATYQILTHRRSKDEGFGHLNLLRQREWGLIIYDEVHLLPAPVFRATAEIQAMRRLGLTATLVREDGREEDVFSLVGPKRYDLPWRLLEREGWIAAVRCREIRIPLPPGVRQDYMRATARERHRIAGENPAKMDMLARLLARHSGRPALVIGQYLRQLQDIAERFDAPLVSGSMSHGEREAVYERFRRGAIPVLVVSKVANFAIDLPDAGLLIQVSGSFGSRQEEAQRIGRILRPKAGDNTAWFYSLVSEDTREQDFSLKRQLFLLEQGYRYEVRRMEEECAIEPFAGERGVHA